MAALVQRYGERPAQPPEPWWSVAAITARSKSSTSQSFSHQLRLLTKRAWWQYTRQPINIIARVSENRTQHSSAAVSLPLRPLALTWAALLRCAAAECC